LRYALTAELQNEEGIWISSNRYASLILC